MIVRKLDFLLENNFKEVILNIQDNKSLSLIYVPNRGYALSNIDENGEHKDTFLIKSDLSPSELNFNENVREKNNFVDLIQMLLNKIYDGYDIPDFEKEHPEFVLLRFIDSFEKDDVDIIENSSEIYKLITLGFIRFDVDILS